jgi:hypothetical protein
VSSNKSFPIGDTIKISAEFRVDDVLTSPATVTILLEEPDGVDVTLTETEDSTGKWSAPHVPDQSGYYRFKVTATGSAAGVREGTFYVATSGIVAD